LFLLASATSGINIGDIIFQFIMLLILVSIIFGLFFIIQTFRKRNKRLKRIEEKLDQLMSENQKDGH
jgi:uncharacterized membrane protein YciS (DUF1049 family)